MLYEHATHSGIAGQETVRFFRVGSSLAKSKNGLPFLSVLIGPGITAAPMDMQRGFPKIPDAGSDVEFLLLNKWIQDCDKEHECGPRARSNIRPPTRLIDLGDKDHPDILRLDCSKTRDPSLRYVVLSHRWGDANQHWRFCTYNDNIEQFKEGIDFQGLPKTFQDAVTVTRGLGIRFLWIDSLCIIQKDPEDWEAECQRMEDVFSSAYCTIAASCASGTTDGFLKPRPKRHCVAIDTQMSTKASRIYICEAIDNFRCDVEQGELSKRGWVYQERALSRRTIHFTKKQVYWECGKGARCETLTKMFKYVSFSDTALCPNLNQAELTCISRKSSFIADPDFPQSALRFYKGMKIMFFETLYEQYSKLGFTEKTDRSMGIVGLEKRLVSTYKTQGKYGILHDFLGRSLLWQRDWSAMEQITYPDDRKVPSWSWMAVEGAMKHTDVPFDSVDWNEEIQSPFRSAVNGGGDSQILDLGAVARDLATAQEVEFILDRPGTTEETKNLKCVVIATERLDDPSDAQLHYVLLVAPKHTGKGCTEYERVGMAVLEKKDILLEGTGLEVQIV